MTMSLPRIQTGYCGCRSPNKCRSKKAATTSVGSQSRAGTRFAELVFATVVVAVAVEEVVVQLVVTDSVVRLDVVLEVDSVMLEYVEVVTVLVVVMLSVTVVLEVVLVADVVWVSVVVEERYKSVKPTDTPPSNCQFPLYGAICIAAAPEGTGTEVRSKL